MCCKPKSSFLIEDILQLTPAKTSDCMDLVCPTRPTPLYLNQVTSLHQLPELRMPLIPVTTSRSVFVTDGLDGDNRLRTYYGYGYNQFHHRNGQYTLEPVSTPQYRGSYSRCWNMIPGYSMAMLAKHHNHTKRKGGQVRFTGEQTASLEKRFNEHKYLSPEERKNLADQLKLSDRQVKTWFQNRRAKWRRANASTSTTDSNQSDDAGSSNTMNEDVFDRSCSVSPMNVQID